MTPLATYPDDAPSNTGGSSTTGGILPTAETFYGGGTVPGDTAATSGLVTQKHSTSLI